METATAVEIDKGRLRQLLLDDFHKLFGKAFANTAPAFPPLPQRRRRPSSLEKAITNKPPNTKFRLLPVVPLVLSVAKRGVVPEVQTLMLQH